MDPTTVAAITTITAVGMVIGLLIGHLTSIWTTRTQIESSTRIAKEQIHAQVISSERMKLIGLLRDSIASYVGCIVDFIRYEEFTKAGDVSVEERWHTTMAKAPAFQVTIELLLNPKEADHVRLSKLLMQALYTVKHDTQHRDQTITDIQTTAQAILKREWEVVKKGKALLDSPVFDATTLSSCRSVCASSTPPSSEATKPW